MITRAESSGFCFGVKNAILKATEEPIRQRCVIGSLAHNQKVIERVKNCGIEFLEEPDSSFDEIVVSAHGIRKEFLEKLKGKRVIDATCKRVQKIIDIASETKENDVLLMVGDSNHSEVKNATSYAKKHYIANKRCLQKEVICEILEKNFSRIFVVFQTTVSKDIFEEYVEYFAKLNDNRVEVFNTICPSVQKRIDESVKIAKDSELMIVVGDKMSANCNLLFEECKRVNPNTIFLSSSSDLPKEFPEKIGITAGASTDPSDVDEIVATIEKMLNK